MDRVNVNQCLNQFTQPVPMREGVEKEAQLPAESVQFTARQEEGPDGPDQPPPGPQKKKWTVLLYSASDNNLVSFMSSDVNELEAVGSDANTNLVVQFDPRGGECKRYLLEKDSDPNVINSPMLSNMGQVDMADPRTLAEFIKWGEQNYPAEHYVLIISDHGNGWKGAISDDSAHGSWMDMPEIKAGLAAAQAETGIKLDVVGYDCCLMANTEVGYEMKDVANYLVASEQTEGADGWPYTRVFTGKVLQTLQRCLRDKIEIDPREFAIKVVKSSDGFPATKTMSATDLGQMPEFALVIDVLADKLMATQTPKETLKAIARSTQSFYGFKDIGDFCTRIINEPAISDQGLKTSAQLVLDILKTKVVIAEEHIPSYKTHGLTMEIPSYGGTGSGYGDLDFAKETKWKQAMDGLNA